MLNIKQTEHISKIILSIYSVYSLVFLYLAYYRNVGLMLYLIPQVIISCGVGSVCSLSKNTSIEYFVKLRNRVFYCFLFITTISLNFIPVNFSVGLPNNFALCPANQLSIYNIYINYLLLSGSFILIIPEFRQDTMFDNGFMSNVYYTSICSKIFFIIILPILIFSSAIFFIYKYEINQQLYVLFQVSLIGGICIMSAYLFILLKILLLKILIFFSKK